MATTVLGNLVQIEGGKGYGRLYCTYTLTKTSTHYTVSGDIYVRAYKGSSSIGNVTVRASSVWVSFGGNILAELKSGTVVSTSGTVNSSSIASFSGSVDRKAQSGSSTEYLTFSGDLTVSASGATTKSGDSGASEDISIQPLDSYRINYYPNGASGSATTKIKYYGKSHTIISNPFSRSGYIFRNWNTASGGTGTTYNAGGTYSGNASLNLYAIWHQKPSLSTSVSSSGYYYAGATTKPYTVAISNITTYDSATVSSIVLTVGSQTVSRTNAGNLSINPSTTGTFTPTVVITDSLGASTSYSLTAIEVKSNDAPTCTVTVTSSGYYYAGVSSTPYSVNITNASAKNSKSISSIVLSVGSQTASRTSNGALSIIPSAAGTNVKISVTITDNIGAKTTYSKDAITVYANDAPTLSYSVISSGNYYAGASVTPYKVSISSLSGKNYKTVSSVKLNFGSQSATLTAAGTFSITPSTAGSITPTIVITDSVGKTNTYTLPAVTVLANTAPTCTAAVASTGNYYAGVSDRPYKVTITNASAKNSKTITSIKLTLGSQTATLTGNGTLSIVPSTAGSFTPTVVITDNIGASTTYTMAAVTIYANTEPTATVTKPSTTVFYAGTPSGTTAYTPYTVTITNAQGYNSKTVTEVKLTLGTQTSSISGNGSITINPSVAGTFTPTVVVKDNIGKTKTYTLTAITVNSLVSQAAEISAQRIKSTGAIDDEGTNAVLKVKLSYSKYTGANGSNYLLQPVVSIGGSQTSAITWYTGWTSSGGFTGAVNWTNYQPNTPVVLYGKITASLNINSSYSIGITPKTTAKTGTAVSATLPQAYYLLAGKAGGHALGVGRKPAEDNTFHVGMGKSIFDNQINAYGMAGPDGTALVINSTVTTTEIKAKNADLTTSSADTDWCQALVKAICTKYPGRTNTVFRGIIQPNSLGWYEVLIYSTSALDSSTGLPQYSFGRLFKYGLSYNKFGTSSYAWSWANVDTNTNTWRGIQDNLTSSTNTTESLSAKQGYLLANGSARDSTKLPLAGGTMTGALIIKKGTVATNTYDDANPKIIFQNSNASQNGSLTWTDYDSVQAPASLTLNGNQGGEYFIAPNIKATSNLYGGGANITSINASHISSGTLAKERLAASGATAGSYGPSANASPAHSGTFSVPYITVDAYGRVTAASTKTITLPASGNTDSKVAITAVTPASETTNYPLTYTATSGTVGVNAHAYNRFWYKQGTASALGYVYLGLGNGTASGTANNSQGYVRMYGPNTGYGQITYANSTANTTHTLPATGGTIINTATLPGRFVIAAVSVDNVSISSGSSKTDFSISTNTTAHPAASYTPLGVVGYAIANASSSGANCSLCCCYRIRLDGSNVVASVRNHASSSAAKIHLYAYVLYVAK